MDQLYTLQREVGRGSYGVVFEGSITETGWWGQRGDRVAIKRLPCCSPESIELYLQELWAMRATARQHPNVIALSNCLLQTGPKTLRPLRADRLPLDLVESVLKGRVVNRRRNPSSSRRLAHVEEVPRQCFTLWLVMEFCNGGDLNHYVLSQLPDVQRSHDVIQQLSSAVTFLHGLGIVHRDLKPDNVLVCLTRTGPVVKVADFGLSKMVSGPVDGEPSRLALSSTCGSDFYMAPEVWAGRNYTAQADIFSLGVLFWAILERITFLEDGSNQEQLGAYVMRGRRLTPLGEALCHKPDLQLVIPTRARRASPLPPPPAPVLCMLLLDMLAPDPAARPTARLLEERVRQATDPR
ncbi:serine/threonine-protein kinase pdik1l-B [Electrophorus electricus]|uniref:Protein kinase domain-containing protein n=1 Tax=Electrophorus electricus TaxID=8005 RepID=A0A4W4EFB1_ELEEL|nr:serine/threonine-protein kinase pdik1l-B [Electrophorus electricus]